jgi:chitodextrinase
MIGYAPTGSMPIGATPAGSGDTTAPVMVGSITASAITATGFTLSWPAATDNVGVTGYEVSINGGSTYTNINNVLTITETGLASSTSYSVYVRAFDASLNRAAPLTATVTTISGASTVTGISISPTTATGSQQFSGVVTGTGEINTAGTYTTSIGSISALGYLTVTQTSAIQYGTVTFTSTQAPSFSALASITVPALGTVIVPLPPSNYYLNNFFLVTLGGTGSQSCSKSIIATMVANEYGIQLNIGMNFDLSAATSLALKFVRPDLSTFTVVPTLGTTPLLTPLNTFAANSYVTYIIGANDLPADGGYQMRLTYVDAYKRLISPVINFAVSP